MLLLIIMCLSIFSIADGNPISRDQDVIEEFRRANSFLDTYPDSSLLIYNEILPVLVDGRDSARVIKCHIGISDVYKNKGQYGFAYDHIWEALLLAESFQDSLLQLEVHEDVGGLYSILQKYEEAAGHFNIAKGIAEGLIVSGDLRESHLVNIFYSMAVISRKTGHYMVAMAYIDSCMAIDRKLQLELGNAGYLNAEIGRNYLHLNKTGLAEEYLIKANTHFKERQQHYEIMTSLFLGDLYTEKRSWNYAEQYYLRCLHLVSIYNTHSDVSKEALQKLSLAQFNLGKIKDAYANLESAFSIGDSLYNSKSSSNSDLFQIKNKYAEELKKRDMQILEQKTELSRILLVQTRLKMLIIFSLFVVIAVLVFYRYQYRIRKIKFEKQQLKQSAEQELEKVLAVTDVKTRELTASALQMIEKERFIDELLNELKGTSSTSYAGLSSRIRRSNKDMWQEFNKRFTEVNSDFYTKLRELHPELSPTEQKHCALIKLNFSSKEMAELLNISLNSVHISRHRIRKKFGLERDDNLSNYLADITGV